ERKPVQVPDIQEDPEYTYVEARRAGFRAMLGVPMLREGVAIGVIILGRKQPRSFTDKQVELATTFADQAVIAIENVRLFEAEQERTHELTESLQQQTATSEVLRVISSSPGDLDPVFNAMLSNATRICEASFGNLWLYEPGIFRAVAKHGPQSSQLLDHLKRQPTLAIAENRGVPLELLTRTKEVVHIADLRLEQAYLDRNRR